jgi:hypothetical protein
MPMILATGMYLKESCELYQVQEARLLQGAISKQWIPTIRQLYRDGCKPKEIYKEIRIQGYTGSMRTVYRIIKERGVCFGDLIMKRDSLIASGEWFKKAEEKEID